MMGLRDSKGGFIRELGDSMSDIHGAQTAVELTGAFNERRGRTKKPNTQG